MQADENTESETSVPKKYPNPYVLRMNDFPGKLFPWYEAEAELRSLKTALNDFPDVYVELGSGSGGHLISRALQGKTAAWVGFEIRFKRTVRTVEKANRLQAGNVYVVRTDGRKLESFFEPSSVQGLYINFPDPWERETRRKHRMLNYDTLNSASRVLRSKGFLSVKTDHQECFRRFVKTVDLWNKENQTVGEYQLAWQTEDLHNSAHAEGNVLTEFERLFLSQSLPICGMFLNYFSRV